MNKYVYLVHYTFAGGAYRLEGNMTLDRDKPIDCGEAVESVRKHITDNLPTDIDWVKETVDSGTMAVIANIMRL